MLAIGSGVSELTACCIWLTFSALNLFQLARFFLLDSITGLNTTWNEQRINSINQNFNNYLKQNRLIHKTLKTIFFNQLPYMFEYWLRSGEMLDSCRVIVAKESCDCGNAVATAKSTANATTNFILIILI